MNSVKCPRCGLVSFATAFGCKQCNAELPIQQNAVAMTAGQFSFGQNVGQTMQPAPPLPLPEYEPEATPIGGWLIVFAVGMVISLGLAVLYIKAFAEFVKTRAFHDLTTEGSSIYVSRFSSGLTFEFIWLTATAATSVILLIRFFRRSSSFPRLAISLLGANIAFAFFDYLMGLNVSNELRDKLAALSGSGNVPDLMPSYINLLALYSILSSGAWIVYFINSRRVESTFIY